NWQLTSVLPGRLASGFHQLCSPAPTRGSNECARQSWGDPAGGSPAQVRSSVPLGSECCVATGDSGCEAYTAITWGVGLSHERSDIAGAGALVHMPAVSRN